VPKALRARRVNRRAHRARLEAEGARGVLRDARAAAGAAATAEVLAAGLGGSPRAAAAQLVRRPACLRTACNGAIGSPCLGVCTHCDPIAAAEQRAFAVPSLGVVAEWLLPPPQAEHRRSHYEEGRRLCAAATQAERRADAAAAHAAQALRSHDGTLAAIRERCADNRAYRVRWGRSTYTDGERGGGGGGAGECFPRVD
jgi:hypothetical protein